jgi:Na+/H+ antiporter
MDHVELLIVGLLVAVAGLSALARRLSVPYPIMLVIGGALFALVPGLPDVELEPDVVLVVFLPPLLYRAAIFANFHDFRADLRVVTLSAVGLVLATMCTVAWVAHALIPGLPWAAAFVLGAILSPTDPLAATTIMRRLDAPRRLVSTIEGEGLFNDATALVAYRIAVAAVVAAGGFSLTDAGLRFVLGGAGGVVVGLAVGAIAAQIRRRVVDTQVNVTISLLTGYAAFVPADLLGASGVLATVTAGIYMGIHGPRVLPTRSRLEGFFVWDILDFIINASLFVLIGLQLRGVVEGLPGYSAITLASYALAVTGVVVGTRLAWSFTIPYVIRALDRRKVQRARRVGARWRLVFAWSGMRGSVSLAVALALPLSTDAGAFPRRNLLIFLTFAVIFFSLVVQGLTLPALIRRLGVSSGDTEAQEEIWARLVAAEAAIAQIDALAAEEWTREETIQRMRGFYEYRIRRFSARAGHIEDEGYEDQSLAYQQMMQIVLGAQREAIVRLRNEGKLSNEIMNRINHELDLEESRLEI